MAEGVCELSSAKLTISSESLEYAMIPARVPWGEIWNVSTRSLTKPLHSSKFVEPTDPERSMMIPKSMPSSQGGGGAAAEQDI